MKHIYSTENIPNLGPPLAEVEPHGRLGVDGIPLVRIHSHAEQARVGLVNKSKMCGWKKFKDYIDELGLVSGPEVVQDRGLVEVGQVGHVLTLLKLGRVDLLDLVPLEDLLVVTNADLDL